MKTFIRCAFISFFSLLFLQEVHAQATAADNNPNTGNFLGFNGAQNLEFRTNNLIRMQQMQTGTSSINGFTITRSGFLGLSQDATFFTAGLGTPFSLLHLNGNNGSGAPQELGYRDWMRYGIVFTHNDDLMFVGPRRRGNDDRTDAAIVWSDGTNADDPAGPDNLIFVFTQGDGTGSDASAAAGLEVARMTPNAHTGIGTGWSNSLQPQRTLDVVRTEDVPQFRITRSRDADVALGTNADFQVSSAGNLYIKPKNGANNRATAIGYLEGDLANGIINSTILDVGGLTRIRSMPDDPAPTSVILGKRAVPGTGGSNADQFIGRVDLPNDADQYLNGTGAFSLPKDKDWDYDATNVWTGTGSGFPSGNVGIGVLGSVTQAKLDVKATAASTAFTTVGIRAETAASTVLAFALELQPTGGSGANIGSYMSVTGLSSTTLGHDVVISNSSGNTYGFRSSVGGGSVNYGGSLTSSGSATTNYGAFGKACGATTNYSVYGESCSTSSGNYAGYFDGNVTVTGTFSNPSDANLKSNVQPIENATGKINALNPVTFEFNPDASPLNLPEGIQFGFIAQEVDAVLPEIVVNNVHPAQYDSLGNEINPSFEYLSIRTDELTPIIVSAINEITGLLEAKTEEVNELQNEVQELKNEVQTMKQKMESMFTVMQSMQAKTNNCCNDGNTGSIQVPASTNDGVKLMQNVPNPFETHTRIDFTLPADANVVLELSDTQGRPLRRLVDGQMNAGPQSIMLDGSSLAPGTYFYTVYANGQMITKKMIKR